MTSDRLRIVDSRSTAREKTLDHKTPRFIKRLVLHHSPANKKGNDRYVHLSRRSLLAFPHRAVDWGGRAHLPEVRKPAPWLMERTRMPLSVQGLPENLHGEDRHRVREQPPREQPFGLARHWLYAIYLMQTARKGISSPQLSEALDITQKSAWFMLHRIRTSCADETLKMVGRGGDGCDLHRWQGNRQLFRQEAASRAGKRRKTGCSWPERPRHGKGDSASGRFRRQGVRAFRTHRQGRTPKVEPGTRVCTNEHRSYSGISNLFCKHERVNHSMKAFVKDIAHTKGIESMWALIKRGFNGVYHHRTAKHCHRYIDEFTFPSNEGNRRIDTIDRIRARGEGASGKRLTYASLTRGGRAFGISSFIDGCTDM